MPATTENDLIASYIRISGPGPWVFLASALPLFIVLLVFGSGMSLLGFLGTVAVGLVVSVAVQMKVCGWWLRRRR